MTDTAVQSPLGPAVERLCTNDPTWLAELRRAALERFAASALPSRVSHVWRYTDPAKIEPIDGEIAVPAPDAGPAPGDFEDPEFERAAGYVLCADGAVRSAALDSNLSARGVVVADLLAAASAQEELVRPRLASLIDSCDGVGARFDDLGVAGFGGGTFVHVPRDVSLERPLRVENRVLASGLVCSRSLISIGPGAEATVVVDITSEDDAVALVHEATEVFVGAGARLRLVCVQLLGRRAVHAPILRARVDRDARLETVSVALGGRLVKSLQTAELAAPGADVRVHGIVFGDRRQHIDHHTFQDHVAPHTTSNLDYRVVAGGRARSAYTGRLRIATVGAGCDAHQTNHNLLLTDKARADTIPELEILTNDVSCSHAAAVGPIDEEQLYFCQSRGLSPAEARRTIVRGFLEPLIARIPGEALLDRVRNALDTRMESADR